MEARRAPWCRLVTALGLVCDFHSPVFQGSVCGFPGGSVVKNCLPVQETWTQTLIREDPTSRGATKPVRRDR